MTGSHDRSGRRRDRNDDGHASPLGMDAPAIEEDAWDEAAGAGEDADLGTLAEAALVSCPYCAATVELLLDPAGGAVQDYVEDCEVCCQPWSVHVAVASDGALTVSLGTLDEA